MTRLLASVSNAREAAMALGAGADIIDLKEPANGALGAVTPAIKQQVVHLVAGRRPVSATTGDLPMVTHALARAIEATASTGVDIIKVGMPYLEKHLDCLPVLSRYTGRGVQIVVVLFAEQRPALHLLDKLAEVGCFGVMLDTADKSAGRLCSLSTRNSLAAFVRHARALGLMNGLAGSLTTEDIRPLLDINPDYLGFRGALCEEKSRTGPLSRQALVRVREIFDEASGNNSRLAV